MWGLTLFDIKDPAAVLFEINMCRKSKPGYYVKCAPTIRINSVNAMHRVCPMTAHFGVPQLTVQK